MSIISRRIPSPLAGAESCGPDQHWDPNYVYAGIKGQCTPKSTPLVQMASEPGFFTSLMSAFSTPTYKAPAAPTYAPVAAPQGMSQNTMIAIGLGAVGLIALVMIARK